MLSGSEIYGMMVSVLLDTTYLISLVDDSRKYHQQAKDFYKYFLDNKYAMILSPIATSEFCVRQPITDLPLHNFQTLAYNIPDSHHLRHLFQDNFNQRQLGESRSAVKDDYKIISQASFNKIDFIITEDDLFCKKMIALYDKGLLSSKPLFCPNGVQTEFKIPVPPPTLFDEAAPEYSKIPIVSG